MFGLVCADPLKFAKEKPLEVYNPNQSFATGMPSLASLYMSVIKTEKDTKASNKQNTTKYFNAGKKNARSHTDVWTSSCRIIFHITKLLT